MDFEWTPDTKGLKTFLKYLEIIGKPICLAEHVLMTASGM